MGSAAASGRANTRERGGKFLVSQGAEEEAWVCDCTVTPVDACLGHSTVALCKGRDALG